MATSKKRAAPKRAPPTKTAPAPAKRATKSKAQPPAAKPRRPPRKPGRPPAVSDEELLAALLKNPSPSRVAAKLGVHRNTITNRLKSPALRDALADHRREAMAIVGVRLGKAANTAVKTLVELAKSSSPQDSVRLGAASAILKLVKDLGKDAGEDEKPDDTWEKPPAWVPRLVEREAPTEGEGGGDGAT